MINERIEIHLPLPWENQRFETDQIGAINFLVGPNGSGKSQFARALFGLLQQQLGGARLLGTDRLRGMEQTTPNSRVLRDVFGDNFRGGIAKRQFSNLKNAAIEGLGMDTIVLLEERMDLRIQIEATLSHLFERVISLEWDSGNLIPMAVRREGGEPYRLDRDECHGIKELLVLLTHLYDKERRYLIVDEPELNLHPQYQAFFMQEVRRTTDNSAGMKDGKIVFLITHSPFILDLRTQDDLKSVISFDLQYSTPRQVASLRVDEFSTAFATARMNAHHRQIFFSDNPVLVEGPHDAIIVEALMEARGLSISGAGSSIIDAGGVEEVNHYLNLCQRLGKNAHFIYDLDSLFRGKLRRCIGDDESIQSFLASAGLGIDFGTYMGELDRRLTDLIDGLLAASLVGNLSALEEFLQGLGGNRAAWDKEQLGKARVAVVTAINRYRGDVVSATSEPAVKDIEGRLNQILNTLEEKNIHVLPGGTIERYLPCFEGNVYDPSQDAKRRASECEALEIQKIRDSLQGATEETLTKRYGDLYRTVRRLPSKPEVDVDAVLNRHLSDYVHELQKIAKVNPFWELDHIQKGLSSQAMSRSNIVSLREFDRTEGENFKAKIGISALLGKGPRVMLVDEGTTIAHIGEFEPDDENVEASQ